MANTRGIRRANLMPFGRFKRRRPRPAQWSSAVWGAAQNVSGVLTENVMALHSDFVVMATAVTAAPVKLARVQFKGSLVVTPQAVTYASNISMGIAVALYTDDVDEDSDVELWGATGNLFAQRRMLWWNCYTLGVIEVPSAQLGTSSDQGLVQRISIDVKSRRGFEIRPDGELTLGVQVHADVTSRVASMELRGIQRIASWTLGSGPWR